jgi:hypothetical protein
MLRRLLIAFFILANLSSQVSVAYACGMMGGAPVLMKHCCCEPDETAPPSGDVADGQGCCQTIVRIADGPGDQVGSLQAVPKLPDYNPQPLPPAIVPVLLSLVLLQTQSHDPLWDEARDHGLYGTDLYLRTQRLRL